MLDVTNLHIRLWPTSIHGIDDYLRYPVWVIVRNGAYRILGRSVKSALCRLTMSVAKDGVSVRGIMYLRVVEVLTSKSQGIKTKSRDIAKDMRRQGTLMVFHIVRDA